MTEDMPESLRSRLAEGLENHGPTVRVVWKTSPGTKLLLGDPDNPRGAIQEIHYTLDANGEGEGEIYRMVCVGGLPETSATIRIVREVFEDSNKTVTELRCRIIEKSAAYKCDPYAIADVVKVAVIK